MRMSLVLSLATAVAAAVAALGCGSAPTPGPVAPTPTPVATSSTTTDAIGGVPAWLRPADACPADVAAATAVAVDRWAGTCDVDLASCLRRCEAREPTACYAAALHVQAGKRDVPLEDALFLRACALGIASACTNRAAAIQVREPDRPGGAACATRTFELACAQRDPWGCTMFGFNLAHGTGVETDRARALAVLPGACVDSEADPACQAARGLATMIESGQLDAP